MGTSKPAKRQSASAASPAKGKGKGKAKGKGAAASADAATGALSSVPAIGDPPFVPSFEESSNMDSLAAAEDAQGKLPASEHEPAVPAPMGSAGAGSAVAAPPLPAVVAHGVVLPRAAGGASAAVTGPSPARLAYQAAVTGADAAKATVTKGLLRKDEDRATMERARAAATASAALLDRRRRAHSQAVFDKDAAVGEAELGLAHGEQALQVAERSFVASRDAWMRSQRSLDGSRAAREEARRELVREDEAAPGGGTLLPKKLPPPAYDPAHRVCRVVEASPLAARAADVLSLSSAFFPPLPAVAPPPLPSMAPPPPTPAAAPAAAPALLAPPAVPALYDGGRLAAFLAMRAAHPGVPDQVLLDFQAAERQPALPPRSDGGEVAGPPGGQAPGQEGHRAFQPGKWDGGPSGSRGGGWGDSPFGGRRRRR